MVLHIKKTLLIRLISLLLSTSVALPSVAYSLPENHSDALRVPLNTLELRKRQKEAIRAVAMVSPINVHLETEEMAIGGITYIGDNGREVIHIFNPAPVFDFTLAKKIKDRYLNGTPLSDSEGMLAASVYRVKQLLGEEGTESPKTIQELIEMADKGNISALVALELKGTLFSIHNLRPGWTFEGWRSAKRAICEKFASTRERREALKLVRNLAIRLTDKGIRPGSGLTLEYAIPVIAKVVKNIDELKLFIDLAIILVDKGINPADALRYDFPAIAKVAKDTDELRQALPFIENFAISADKRINPSDILIYDIPAIAKLAKNIDELRETLQFIENFAIILVDKGINPGSTLRYSIPAIAKVAKNIDELKETLQFIENFAIIKEIYYGSIFRDIIPAIAKVAKNIDELRETLQFIENFAISVADKRSDFGYFLGSAISAIAKVAKNIEELKEALPSIENLAIRFTGYEAYDPQGILGYRMIPAITEVAKNIDELKEVLSASINFITILADKGIKPRYTLQDIIPAIAKVAKNIDELRETLQFIENLAISVDKEVVYSIPEIAEVAKNIKELRYIWDNILSRVDSKHLVAVSAENISDALGFLKQGRDFRVEYHPAYDRNPGAGYDSDEVPAHFTVLDSGYIKRPSVGHVELVADAYTTLQEGRHDEAYDLVMKGLLGEDFMVNVETAIGILQALITHYGRDTEKGIELAEVLSIVTRYKDGTDQKKMKVELRQSYNAWKKPDHMFLSRNKIASAL